MNAKIYNGNVQPNPKEFKIWVNDEGLIKTWNGTEWVENTAGESGSGSGESGDEYIKAYCLKLCPYDRLDVRSMLGTMFPKYYSFEDGAIYYGDAFMDDLFPGGLAGAIAPEFLFIKNKTTLGELTKELNSPKDLFEIFLGGVERGFIEYEEISVNDFFNSSNKYIFRITYEDTGETKDYYSDLGMQLKDWVSSTYNTDNIILDETNIFIKDNKRYHFIYNLQSSGGSSGYDRCDANTPIAYTHVLARPVVD